MTGKQRKGVKQIRPRLLHVHPRATGGQRFPAGLHALGHCGHGDQKTKGGRYLAQTQLDIQVVYMFKRVTDGKLGFF